MPQKLRRVTPKDRQLGDIISFFLIKKKESGIKKNILLLKVK